MNTTTRPLLGALLAATLCVAAGAAAAQNGPPPGGAPGGGAPAAVRTVQEIKFTGNKKISTATLSSQIQLKVGDVNTKEAVGAAMDKIGDLYKKAGLDLSYMVDISLPDQSHTIVNFIIDENGTGGNKGAAPRAPRAGGAGGPGGPGAAGGPPPGGANAGPAPPASGTK